MTPTIPERWGTIAIALGGRHVSVSTDILIAGGFNKEDIRLDDMYLLKTKEVFKFVPKQYYTNEEIQEVKEKK